MLLSGIQGAVIKPQSSYQSRWVLRPLTVPRYRQPARGCVCFPARVVPEIYSSPRYRSAPLQPAPTANLSYFWRRRDLLQRSSSRRGPVIREECPRVQVWRLGLFFVCRSGLFSSPKRDQIISACRSRLDSKTAGVLYDLEIYARSDFGVLGVALLLFVPPVPTSVSSELLLEPGKDAHLRTTVPGKISEVFVRQGQEVKAGQLLAVLQNPEIEAKARVAATELTLG